jgi:hypothetical protein
MAPAAQITPAMHHNPSSVVGTGIGEGRSCSWVRCNGEQQPKTQMMDRIRKERDNEMKLVDLGCIQMLFPAPSPKIIDDDEMRR